MRPFILSCSFLLILSSQASADRLELADGTLLQGSYVGGEAGLVRFQVKQGELRSIPVKELRSLQFEQAEELSLGVPSQTRLTLRLTQPIGHARHAGSFFKGVLETALIVEGTTVAAEGTPALGRLSSSKGPGGESFGLRLTDLIIAGQRHRVTTEELPLNGTLDAQSLLEFRLSSGFSVLESHLGK